MSHELVRERFQEMVQQEGWYDTEDNTDFIFTHHIGDYGIYELQMALSRDSVEFSCITGITALRHRLHHTVRFLNRLNRASVLGTFTLDEGTLNILIHYALPTGKHAVAPSQELIDSIWLTLISEFEQWNDDLLLVSWMPLEEDGAIELYFRESEGEA